LRRGLLQYITHTLSKAGEEMFKGGLRGMC
jgi:hypothetical protein